MPFISNTDEERKEMLAAIGVQKFADLLQGIPSKFIHKEDCCLDSPHSELEITRRINILANKNLTSSQVNSFLGGGIYDHYIPAAVDQIIMRPEFHSAYTPYQAEVSQGTLQYIYEYQTLICELTGMEISNAGMYDGATAAAEAVLMAARYTGKFKALLAGTLHPLYREVIKTYTEGVGIELIDLAIKDGLVDLKDLEAKIDDNTGCVLIQTPNFFGNIEESFHIEEIVHSSKKALLVAAVDPISLVVLNSPAEYRADIVIGEGQALGNNQNFGGPLFGFMATNLSLARKLPGRIVGATLDVNGKRAYALTLQAREQHIRRAKATSNICSNDALCTLAATVYLCLMGKKGLQDAAVQSATKAHYLAEKIFEIKGFKPAFPANFFKEFTVRTPAPAGEICKKLQARNILPGIDLAEFGFDPHLLMVAVTEKKRKEDLDDLVKNLREVYNG